MPAGMPKSGGSICGGFGAHKLLLLLRVSDDGVSMYLAVLKHKRTGHWGLLGMREGAFEWAPPNPTVQSWSCACGANVPIPSRHSGGIRRSGRR